MSEVVYIKKEDAKDSIWCSKGTYVDESGEFVVEDKYDDGSGRWESYHMLVIKRRSDGKLFCQKYSVGLTEMQESSLFELVTRNDLIPFKECKRVEKIVYEYKLVED